MFIGEACCLPLYHFVVKRNQQRQAVAPQSAAGQYSSPLLDDDDSPLPATSSASNVVATGEDGKPLPDCPTWFFLLLCSLDLTATTLNFIGLLYVSASLNQMFRGSMAVFVALFSLCLLRRRLSLEQWVAIGIVVLGLTAVGFSSYLEPTVDDGARTSAFLVFFGLLLILAGSALNSIQNVVEELLMKLLVNYREPHPLEIVGWEGVYGMFLSALIMLPAVYYLPGSDCGGRQENSLDTLYKLQNPKVVALVLSYIAGLGAMNYSSMELSRLLSAVVRNLVSAMRTVFVWVLSVALYYAVGPQYGEKLGLWSVVELCGFILLIGGSVLYSQSKERTASGPNTAAHKKSFDGGVEDEEEEDDEVAINGVHNRAPIIP